MELDSVFRLVVVVLSFVLLNLISVSARFKEATLKDGSLFVNYIIMLSLWLLISFLSHSFCPRIVTYGNTLLLVYFTPYSRLYKELSQILNKLSHVILYYFEEYKVSQYTKIVLHYLYVPLKYTIIIPSTFIQNKLSPIFTAVSTKTCNILERIYDGALCPAFEYTLNMISWSAEFLAVLCGKIRHNVVSCCGFSYDVFHPIKQVITDAIFDTFKCIRRTCIHIWENSKYYMCKLSNVFYKYGSIMMSFIKDWMLSPLYRCFTCTSCTGTYVSYFSSRIECYICKIWSACCEYCGKIASGIHNWILSPFHRSICKISAFSFEWVLLPLYHCSCNIWVKILTLTQYLYHHVCNQMYKWFEYVYNYMKTNTLVLNCSKYITNWWRKVLQFIIVNLLSTLYDGYDILYGAMQYIIRVLLFYYSIYSSQITLKKQHIDISISNRYATVKYEYNFENMSTYEKSEELKFEITLDSKAFISNFIADIDGKLFHGETKEKKESNRQYKKAVKEDKNAILISKPYDNIPHVFQIKTNISRNSNVKLIITIEQYIEKMFDYNELTVELINQFLSYNIDNSFEYTTFNIDINENSGIYDFEITSPTQIVINKEINNMDHKYSLDCQLKYDYTVFRKHNPSELVLKYKLKGEEDESYMLFDKKTDTFCHIISNNDIMDGYDGSVYFIPRKVVFIIDKSESMKGMKWIQTTNETIVALHNLKASYDKYCVILFDDKLHCQNTLLLDVNDTNISKSIDFIHNMKPSGATDINDALLLGLKVFLNKDESNDENELFMNQIIFITDGRPTSGVINTSKILRSVKCFTDTRAMHKICIFCFGIGEDNGTSWIKDLNYSFLRELAITNNGFDIRIKQSQTANNLNKYFKILSNPLLLDLNVEYKSDTISIKDTTKTSFNTLYTGSDVIICGKMTDYEANDKDNNTCTLDPMRTEGEEEDEDEQKMDDSVNAWITAKSVALINNRITSVELNKKISFKMDDIMNNTLDENTENIERIWAYLNIQHSYNINQKAKEKKRQMDLAMQFKFVTPYTNMIVVQEKDGINGPKTKRKIKLVLIGDYGCGKTSLLSKYTNDNHPNTDSIYHKNVIIDNNDIDLELWDIPDSKYPSLNVHSLNLRNADGIIYVCSINDIKSQNNIQGWKNDIWKYMIHDEFNSILIANKSDLIGNDIEKQQRSDEMKTLSHVLGMKHIITSVKQNINVNNAFENILRSICNKYVIDEQPDYDLRDDEDDTSGDNESRLQTFLMRPSNVRFIGGIAGSPRKKKRKQRASYSSQTTRFSKDSDRITIRNADLCNASSGKYKASCC